MSNVNTKFEVSMFILKAMQK